MKNYLSSHYQFRVNHLREMTEWRPINVNINDDVNVNDYDDDDDNGNNNVKAAGCRTTDNTEWRELDKWAFNSIYGEVCDAGFDIRHDQIYAQLLAELETGERTWFTKDEERRIQQHNSAFYAPTPLQKGLAAHYRAPLPIDDPDAIQLMTSQELCRTIAKHHPALLTNLDLKEFGRQVAAVFPFAKRTNAGRLYKVVALSA